METWFGLFAPARTSRAVIERLRAEVDRATRSAEVRSRLEMGSGRSLRIAPAETEAFVRAEVAKWTGVLRKAGIEPERAHAGSGGPAGDLRAQSGLGARARHRTLAQAASYRAHWGGDDHD